jgi:hypothetical protein
MSTVDPVRHFGTGNNVVSLLADENIDPITFSVILNRFSTIAREMTLALAASRGEVPLVQPTEPDAATWLEENMREGDNYLLDPLP